MILEYHRPQTLQAAMALLERSDPLTVPLAGGSALNQPGMPAVAVVDLQNLGLDGLERRGNQLHLGAMVTLQTLLEVVELPSALQSAIQHEAAYNLRQVATVAGTLVSAGGRSPFLTAMLALDPVLTLIGPGEAGPEPISLGELLPLRHEQLRGRLITALAIPLHARLAYEYVARSPADRPIVCAAAAFWPSGRARLTLGGYGTVPVLVLDGSDLSGADIAAGAAYSQAGDQWASAEYRREIAGVLAQRCLDTVQTAETALT